MDRRKFLKLMGLAGAVTALPWRYNLLQGLTGNMARAATMLDPVFVDKYASNLVIPPAMPNNGTAHNYTIGMRQIQQNIGLKVGGNPLSPTTVWAYGSETDIAGTYNWPAFTIEAKQGTPVKVTWFNKLDGITYPLSNMVDQTLHWADPLSAGMVMAPYTGPVPTVVHVHGAEVRSDSDGHPDAWFTPASAYHQGAQYGSPGGVAPPGAAIFQYPNTQQAGNIWYHDHGLGVTRLNVYMGLAGFYLIRDLKDTGGSPDPGQPNYNPLGLPGPAPGHAGGPDGNTGPFYEIPIVIQDRLFDDTGQLFWPSDVPPNPTVHPYWVPEFMGNIMTVNGVPWPFLEVEPRRYRFRFLNGCNARFLKMALDNGATVWHIGTDGGRGFFTGGAVPLKEVFIAPGERADVIIDFTNYVNQNITLTNTANSPYPDGDPVDEHTGVVMQFKVVTPLNGTDKSKPPQQLQLGNPKRIVSNRATPKRRFTLNEILSPDGPLMVLVNYTRWGAPVTEQPKKGSTEIWEIVNMTMDAHPMHLHLVQFQLVNRQDYNVAAYTQAFLTANPDITPGVEPEMMFVPNAVDVTPYVQGLPKGPLPEEQGWKDTIKMYPGQVSRIIVRFTQQDGLPFTFDPTAGPGYVWHCHIIDHEDNEMMRPYKVIP